MTMLLEIILIAMLLLGAIIVFKILTSATFWLLVLFSVAAWFAGKEWRRRRRARKFWASCDPLDDLDARLDGLEASMERLSHRLFEAFRSR